MISVLVLNFVCLMMFASQIIHLRTVKISACLLMIMSFLLALDSADGILIYFLSFGVLHVIISAIKSLSNQ